MHEATQREIEKRAVWELITYFEDQIDKVILLSKKELEKKNLLRSIQGLSEKERIDSQCVRNAIKTINSKEHSNLPQKAGGKKLRKEK